MASPIQKQIDQHLTRVMLSVPKGETREATAERVIEALRPFLKKPSQHSLTVMMVEALFKFREAVRVKGNRVHIRRDMFAVRGECPYKLSFDQLTNFSVLRFFGLAVHADEKTRGGYWTLTRRGSQFLRGEISIPRKVWTYAGHPVHFEPETSLPIHIEDYRKELPDFETYFDFKQPAPKAVPQLSML